MTNKNGLHFNAQLQLVATSHEVDHGIGIGVTFDGELVVTEEGKDLGELWFGEVDIVDLSFGSVEFEVDFVTIFVGAVGVTEAWDNRNGGDINIAADVEAGGTSILGDIADDVGIGT